MEARISPMNRLPAERVVAEIAQLITQAINGYTFRPTEEELIDYLKAKVTGSREPFCIIPTLENIYEMNPWDLPAEFNEKSIVRSKDQEWWFICPQTRNQRISRKTPCGSSWKITGKHIDIKAKNDDRKIGSKITLVFIDRRKSKSTRSNWVMHEFHLHPDDTGFVLCCLKMKQEEKADDQEPFIQKVNLVNSLEEEVDEMPGTSNFIGAQADKSCDIMDCDNAAEQLPVAEHHVQALQNQLHELIVKGSSSSTDISFGSGTTVTNEWSWIEPWMSPLIHDSFPNGELLDCYDPLSEAEADTGVIQNVQFGETSCDNRWAKKNQRPVCDTLEGVVPLEEEKRSLEQKFNHPHDTERIIAECAFSEGAPAKAKAAEFKEKGTPMIQPLDDGKIEPDNISRRETWNNSLSSMRSTASTSCYCQNKYPIDPGFLIAVSFAFAFVLLASVIVDGVCRISDGVNETIRHIVFFRRF